MKMADSIAQTAAPVASKLTAPELMQSTHARVALLLGRVVFYSLITLIAFVALPYGTVEPWWQALFECAVFTLAALWLVEGWLSGSWQLSRCYVLLPLLALAGFGLVQALGLVLGLAVSESERAVRWPFYLGIALLLSGALVSANSRGGVFSLLCQLLCAALFFSAPQRRRDAFASDIGSHAVGRAQRLAS